MRLGPRLAAVACYAATQAHSVFVIRPSSTRPRRRKILNHGKHGTTRKGDPNVFPFLCPSRGQLPPVGWGRSVVITCLDNRRAAQSGLDHPELGLFRINKPESIQR